MEKSVLCRNDQYDTRETDENKFLILERKYCEYDDRRNNFERKGYFRDHQKRKTALGRTCDEKSRLASTSNIGSESASERLLGRP